MKKPIPHPVDQWARAFVEGRNYSSKKHNIAVVTWHNPPMVCAYFHGNVIALRTHKGIEMSASGYGHSPTTRSRLNALCRALGLCAPFYQHANQLWYESRPIGSSEWVTVLGPLGTIAASMMDRDPEPNDTRGFHVPECGAPC